LGKWVVSGMTLEEIITTKEFAKAVADDSPYTLVLALRGISASPDSEAIIVEMDEEFEIAVEHKTAGFIGLLDFEDIAHLWMGFVEKKMTARQQAEFLIHYAKFDAQPAWFPQLPDADSLQ
jgi:hypothetical protein